MTQDATQPRVLLIEDHRVFAEALQLMLETKADMLVVGTAHTGADGIRLAAQTSPDVILLDYRLPDMTGADVARQLRAQGSDAAVVVLSGDPTDEALAATVEAGVVGFLPKSGAAAVVVGAVRRAAAGEMLLGPDALALRLRRVRAQ
ncbi:MAG: response regulator transcription factor, partial [Chloroflexota bacterium]